MTNDNALLRDYMTGFNLIFSGFQHFLAMIAPLLAVPVIVGSVLDLPMEQKVHMISASLLASAIATFIQCRRVGPVGSGLLAVQGTSFVFLIPCIEAGKAGGLALIGGMVFSVCLVEVIMANLKNMLHVLFPSIVTSCVVILIGLTLIPIAVIDLGGGDYVFRNIPEQYANLSNLGLGVFTFLLILLFHCYAKGLFKLGAISLGILGGCLCAWLTGNLNGIETAGMSWFNVPVPLKYGLSFDVSLILPFALAYMISAVESIGDLTATAQACDLPIEGMEYEEQISGGLLIDGLGSGIAGLLNSTSLTTYSQNVGVISMTGIKSNVVGIAVAGFLLILSLIPPVGVFVANIPKPVMGGATLILFSMITISGIKVLFHAGLSERNCLILAIALALGLGAATRPELVNHLPVWLKPIIGNGVCFGALGAILANLLIPQEKI
jgi:NCS2 family nucleobase:cation symporter-2/xanthine permease XanP